MQGLAGNDTITLALVNDEAAAGAGDDLIQGTAAGTVTSEITGGAGNDTVNLTGTTRFSGTVRLGEGTTPLLCWNLSNANVFGDEGSDTIALKTPSTLPPLVVALVLTSRASLELLLTPLVARSSVVLRKTPLLPDETGSPLLLAAVRAPTFCSSLGAFANSIVGGGQGADSIRVGRAAIATIAGGGLADTIRLVGSAFRWCHLW